MIGAGDLNRRVVFRSTVRTEEEGGGYTDTPGAGVTLWAKVEPLQGDEQIAAMQTGMTAPHRFTVRYRRGITGTTEAEWDGRRFNVRSVTDTDVAHRELVILADEVRP